MSKWICTTLGEIVSSGGGKIQTGPFGSQLHAADYVEVGIPCIMPANMKNNRVDLTDIKFISKNDAKRLSQHLVKLGDIVYSRRGDITQKALILKSELGYFCGTGCLLIRPGKNIDSEFLTYHLSTPSNKSWIINQAVGATMPNLNTTILSKVPLRVPDKTTQKKIAAVLSALDTKIDLNNRINAELEAMAKSLYDYWFVQFDFPDKNGKPYKSSGGKMAGNETLKREIPDGWAVGELSDIANITMGQSPPGESYNENGDGMIFFQGCTDFGKRFPTVRIFTTQPSRFAKAGDILLSVRAPVGTLNIANMDCCIGRGLAALTSKSECISYLYGVMTDFKQVFDRRNVDGTTFGSITKDDLFSLKVIKPEKLILEKFQRVLTASFEKQNRIELENQHLSSLRDWLLPMLMNGQVKVS